METTENLVEVKDLVLRFYTYEGIVEALDRVNLKIRPGEILGLVGETGCGKSVTSLSILGIVMPPGKIEGGSIIFNLDGKKINIINQKEDFLRTIRGKDVSMVFQEPRAYLNPVYTVEYQIGEVILLHRQKEFIQKALEQLKKERSKILEDIKRKKGRKSILTKLRLKILGLYISMYKKMLKNPNALSIRLLSKIPIIRRFRNPLKREVRKEVVNLLKMMQIADPERVAGMYPHELSGGMAQRVVIAMALACRPLLLICDEPTTNLDVTVQAQILELIQELRKTYKSSILYITHDLGVVAQICDRVAVMYAGVVVELADVNELFKFPLHPYTKGLLESIPKPGKELKSIPGSVPNLIDPPRGCRFHPRCWCAMEICRKIKPPFVEAKEGHMVSCFLYGEKGGKINGNIDLC
ncbi:MAG: ABC transporter ATP-binding protein [Candidatus Aenigmatarchaeota archaeon]|nr:MAG: ABC transporter ATP-binding protein [Candidatus Aenigmarchaeota archaeon]